MRKEVHRWHYKDQQGNDLGYVCRFETEDGKQVLPYFNSNGESGIPEAINNKRPLYGLFSLKDKSKPVFIVEGEKCAAALHGLGLQAVTSLGGAQAATKSDWSTLEGFEHVILLPDMDRQGEEYMRDVYHQMQKLFLKPEKIECVFLAGLSAKQDICDWIKRFPEFKEWNELSSLESHPSKNELVSTLLSVIEALDTSIPSDWVFEEGMSGLRCMTAQKLTDMTLTPPVMLLDPIISEKSLSMIYAKRGVGKTYFALNIAIALATGTDFLCYKTKQASPVLYVDGEMQIHLMQQRMRQLAQGKSLDNLHLISSDCQIGRGMPDLSSPEGQKEIDEFINKHQIKVLFIDNLSTLVRQGEENKGESWLPVQMWLIGLRSKGVSVVVVHHSGKTGAMRGSSRMEDVLDTSIMLCHPEDYQSNEGARFEVHYEKHRSFYGEDATSFEAHLTDEGWQMKRIGSNSTMTKVMELSQKGLNQTEIAKELNIHKSTVSRALSN